MLTKDKVLKGRYRVVDRLGNSTTGAVYEAFDNIRKTNVALKEILIDSEKVPAIGEREILKRAFADRAKVLAEVKHESLPQIRGYFSEFDRQYLVIELITGDDSGELLDKNEKPISFTDAANWADQLLDALDYLHTLAPPIIHGDVKPQNVRLNSRGRIKLLGFDIIESLEAKLQTIVTNQAAVVAGSSSYLPLEQLLRVVNSQSRGEFAEKHQEKFARFAKQTADARSDIYALGATLYHLMTGQTPVDALERANAVWSEEFDPLPTAQELNPSIPTEVSETLMKALEIEPEKRFGSAMEMRQALQTVLARAQEREAEKAKTKAAEAARETLFAEEKRLEQERQLVEQERLRLEEERQKQAELIEQQLKAAQAERLKAEQRAAEAEKKLQEKKVRNEEKNFPPAIEKSAANFVQKPLDADAPVKPKLISDQTTELFAATAQNKESTWLMPAVILMILLVVGAAGIWILRSPKNVAAESNQPRVNQMTMPAENPAPPSELAPAPTVEKVSTVVESPAPSVETEKLAVQTAPKIKPIPQPTVARVVKPAPVPKASAPPKKAVTVDDLIGN